MPPFFHRLASQCFTGLATILIVALSPAAGSSEEPTPWPLRDGDRVVLVGDTLIERDQKYGYLETYLTIENPELNLTFRNLGWSGDTVAGLSRAGFDPPEAGFRALIEQIKAAKPTVLIIGYGMADSFDGEAGLPRFVAGLNTLLDAVAPSGVRVALLSPIPHEDLGRPLPEPAAHNRDLERYTEAIRMVAGQRDARFVELLHWLRDQPHHHTDDGTHLTEEGYHTAGYAIALRLGQSKIGTRRQIEIDHGELRRAQGTTISAIVQSSQGHRFLVKDDVLPPPLGPGAAGQRTSDEPEAGHDLCVRGLPPGKYVLQIDGQMVLRSSASAFGQGIHLKGSPEQNQVEQLRKVINAKNLLFFHRWRPQNNTYLFGFRNHEQGNNAIEVPQFDPLVEAREREIAVLRKPVQHVYELMRESEVAK